LRKKFWDLLKALVTCFTAQVYWKKTYEMYNELGQKVDDADIKPTLITIAQDSLKHYNLFEEISNDLINKNPSEKTCKTNFGKTWTHIEELTKLVKQKNH